MGRNSSGNSSGGKGNSSSGGKGNSSSSKGNSSSGGKGNSSSGKGIRSSGGKGKRSGGNGNGKGNDRSKGGSKKASKQQRRAEEMALVGLHALKLLKQDNDIPGCVDVLKEQGKGGAFRPFLEHLRSDLPNAAVTSQLVHQLRAEAKLGMAAELIAALTQQHSGELVPLLHTMLQGEVDMITAIRIVLEPENDHHDFGAHALDATALLGYFVQHGHFRECLYLAKNADMSIELVDALLGHYKGPRGLGLAAIAVEELQLIHKLEDRNILPLQFMRCPVSSEHIHLVQDEASVLAAQAMLSQTQVIGLDRESCPVGLHPGEDPRAALLQIASRDDVFLFDLLTLHGRADELIGWLLCNDAILKLGMGWESDLKTLSDDYPASCCYQSCQPLLEVTELFNSVEPSVQQPVGLKRMCNYTLQQRLNKTQQTSNWSRRPLNEEQIEYAALDAYILVMLYDALSARNETSDTEAACEVIGE